MKMIESSKLPREHRWETARGFPPSLAARRPKRRWALFHYSVVWFPHESSVRFRLRFRCPSSSMSCLKRLKIEFNAGPARDFGSPTLLRRAVLVPRVHRRLYRVLILVHFWRRGWHRVSGNWRCGQRWCRDGCVWSGRLTESDLRFQRSARDGRKRVVFLLTTNKV